MQRGFQAAADRLAAAVRSELGLGDHDRLDPRAIATEYGIPVVPITELVSEGASPASIHRLTIADDGCFSAGTVLVGTTRLIIFNPIHSDGRLANSVAHELAHVLLEHTPGLAIGPGGCRIWDQDMEDEANLLAAILLVPREAALVCARVGLPPTVGAARFGVSPDLMRWRTNKSGANRQAQAEARRHRRTIPRLSAQNAAKLPSVSDMAWLGGIDAEEWRQVVARCGRALSAGSLSDLDVFLRGPL